MTTIINTPQSPAPAQDSASGVALGIIVGAIIVIALIFFGVRYYWHATPTNSTPTQTTVLVPSAGTTVNLSAPTTPAAPTNSTTTTNSY